MYSRANRNERVELKWYDGGDLYDTVGIFKFK